MKKKLLIYAHYYIPDTASTGQIIAELAEGLLDQFEVTVICVVPSYDGVIKDKYKSEKFYHENINGVNVIRVRVPEFTKSNKISRIKNILAYFFGSLYATRKVGKQDYVLTVSQPPILGGLLGVYGKWRLKRAVGRKRQEAKSKNPLYYNKNKVETFGKEGFQEESEASVSRNPERAKYIYQIQDFNPEQIEAVSYFKCKTLIWLLRKLDKFSCHQADLVITVGRDLKETIEKRFEKHPEKMPKISLINNWIDEKEIYPLEENHPQVERFKRKYGLTNKFIIAYSGNLGHYYDLLELLKVVKHFKPGTKSADGRVVAFIFIGEGSLLEKMKEYVADNHMDNVSFIPYQPKKDLIYSLNAVDVHWCVNAKGIKGVSCPSKYYGIAAAGKPVLGVLEEGTEIRCIIEETEGGLCCEPGDYKSVIANVTWFIENAGSELMMSMGIRSREYLVENLTKENSVKKYAEVILRL